MRVLITGAAGMLGQDVVAAANGAAHEVIAPPYGELDITDADAVTSFLKDATPDVVVNCAAFTAVDLAEDARDAAFAVNGAGAGHVARASGEVGAWVVHVSTDYVFDGSKREPYVESDPVRPLSVYGRSKLDGEVAVAHAAPGRHTIVRSSWLFGAGGPCFPATIMRLASQRPELEVVDDQVGCPTFTEHLASALLTVAANRIPGLLHVAGAGHCSWYEFARAIVELADLSCDVKPGRTENLERPAPRPAYSVLGTERPAEAPTLPQWRQGLEQYLALTVTAS
jgi:dTDP-4-dehydrorhamnose reductase